MAPGSRTLSFPSWSACGWASRSPPLASVAAALPWKLWVTMPSPATGAWSACAGMMNSIAACAKLCAKPDHRQYSNRKAWPSTTAVASTASPSPLTSEADRWHGMRPSSTPALPPTSMPPPSSCARPPLLPRRARPKIRRPGWPVRLSPLRRRNTWRLRSKCHGAHQYSGWKHPGPNGWSRLSITDLSASLKRASSRKCPPNHWSTFGRGYCPTLWSYASDFNILTCFYELLLLLYFTLTVMLFIIYDRV